MVFNKNKNTTPEPEAVNEWAGSRILIESMDEIVQDARQQQITIYDRSDFPFPTERIQVLSEIKEVSGEEVFAVQSVLQLDKLTKWNFTQIKQKFNEYLYLLDPYSDNAYQCPPLTIRKTVFGNLFRVNDKQSGGKFFLCIREKNKTIEIANDMSLENSDKKKVIELHAPPLRTVSPEEQLISLGKVTALAADFLNTTEGDDLIDTLPLKREYIFGRERYVDKPITSTTRIGHIASQPATETPLSKEEINTQNDISGIERFQPNEMLTLNDIGGLKMVKRMLSDVAVSFNNQDVMEKWGAKRPQGVLLYGEPGTGKTMLVQALANEVNAELWSIQSTDIYRKWLGQSEQRIKEIFSKVQQAEKPTILFFDEIDAIVGVTDSPSSGGADNSRNAVAGVFKQELNDLSSKNPHVMLAAATNDIERIDPSLIRSGRFDYKIYVPLPDQQAREEIVAIIISKTMLGKESETFKVFSDELQVNKVAADMEDMSGADITEIFRRVVLTRAMEEARTKLTPPSISQADIQREIKNFRLHG